MDVIVNRNNDHVGIVLPDGTVYNWGDVNGAKLRRTEPNEEVAYRQAIHRLETIKVASTPGGLLLNGISVRDFALNLWIGFHGSWSALAPVPPISDKFVRTVTSGLAYARFKNTAFNAVLDEWPKD